MGEQAREADHGAVRRVLAGEVDAFAEIVQRWQGPLVNLAFRYCRDPGQAEEWAQEAFLQAFRSLDRWRAEAKFSTWLFAMASNLYRSRARRARLPEVPLTADDPALGNAPEAQEYLESLERDELVRRAVCRLPARYRDVLALYYLDERGLEETAEILRLPAGTVKARLHRGRALLRKRLEPILSPTAATEATNP